MRTLNVILVGGIVGLLAVAIWIGTRVDANTANYAYADSHPGTPLPEGVYGPPVPVNGALASIAPADNYVTSEGLA